MHERNCGILMSFQTVQCFTCFFRFARTLMRSCVRLIYGTEPFEVSFLFFLRTLRQCGGFEILTSTSGGAQVKPTPASFADKPLVTEISVKLHCLASRIFTASSCCFAMFEGKKNQRWIRKYFEEARRQVERCVFQTGQKKKTCIWGDTKSHGNPC